MCPKTKSCIARPADFRIWIRSPTALTLVAERLGGNKSETILRVLIPAALPGIMGGFLLATSRAIGETMIVVLAAGGQANLTIDILDQMTTVTVQITELLIGDAEFDRANTLSVFGLGLVLFVSTLLLNLAAIQVVRRYRQRYS